MSPGSCPQSPPAVKEVDDTKQNTEKLTADLGRHQILVIFISTKIHLSPEHNIDVDAPLTLAKPFSWAKFSGFLVSATRVHLCTTQYSNSM